MSKLNFFFQDGDTVYYLPCVRARLFDITMKNSRRSHFSKGEILSGGCSKQAKKAMGKINKCVRIEMVFHGAVSIHIEKPYIYLYSEAYYNEGMKLNDGRKIYIHKKRVIIGHMCLRMYYSVILYVCDIKEGKYSARAMKGKTLFE